MFTERNHATPRKSMAMNWRPGGCRSRPVMRRARLQNLDTLLQDEDRPAGLRHSVRIWLTSLPLDVHRGTWVLDLAAERSGRLCRQRVGARR